VNTKLTLAVILSILCIILSEVGNNMYTAYLQIMLYTGVVALILSRYHEDK